MQELTRGEVMHLRRLLGWVACEIGQTPDELVATVRNIVPKIGEVSEEGKARLVQAHQQSCNVPKYVRDAVRALHIAIDCAPASKSDCETPIEGTYTPLRDVAAMVAKLNAP